MEESERLRGEGDQIKFIDLRFERGQAVGFRKVRERQYVLRIACSWDECSNSLKEEKQLQNISLLKYPSQLNLARATRGECFQKFNFSAIAQ